MKDKKQKTADPGIYIAALSATFRPAPDAHHVTHWLTTDEVYDAICKIDPAAQINKEQVFQALTDAGYQFQNRPGSSGIEFRWMMQAKEL